MGKETVDNYLGIVTAFRHYLEGELERTGNPPPLPPPRPHHVLPQQVGEDRGGGYIKGRDKGRGGDGLNALRKEAIQCQKCRLSQSRTNVVFGVGHPNPKLVIVGEAPGLEEDRRGEPFVGRAGELLTKMLSAIDVPREQVYIANIIKCRPPNNRNPLPDEIKSCLPYLLRQLSVLSPSIILSLGNFATQILLGSSQGITKLRGKIYAYEGIKLIPTFHPAYLLRNPSLKRAAWEDMKLLRKVLGDGC